MRRLVAPEALRRAARHPSRLLRSPAARRSTPESTWFWDHYEVAADQVASFCEPRGVQLRDAEIADIGCGDGIMALGLCHRAGPRRLIGFDLVPTSRELLLARSIEEGVAEELPAELEFKQSTATQTPAGDDAFDFVYSWSAFEHIAEPREVLNEVRRILRPTGHFFLQLWPFYTSAKGSHLWDWFEEDFHHLGVDAAEVVAQMRASDRHPAEWTSYMSNEFLALNRVTLAELQEAVLAAGFVPRWVDLMTSPTRLTPDLARFQWADLGIGGIKLLATPRG